MEDLTDMSRPTPDDRLARFERVLGRLLLSGVVSSTTLLAIGLAGWVAGLRGELVSVAFQAGLLVLMATPVARVLASVVEYLRERDWVFVATTLTVLAVLAATVVAAIRVAMGGEAAWRP